jgi:CPA1 family monovalent cation:H+ antiporter
VNEIELLLSLLGVVAVVSWLARRLNVPYPIFLVVAGLAIGFAPGLPDVTVDPEVIFLVFLPPLIHAAAWTASPRHLRRNARTLGLLALGLVLATTALVAVVVHALLPELPWAAAFLVGAIVSPTDTVAATAIFRRLGAPERVVALVEGESLINDGAALVVYRVALGAALTGTFAAGEAAAELVIVGIGGALVGLVVAVVIAQIRKRVEDSTLEVTLTLLTAYLAYVPAEELGLSGILAAVSSGLYLGWRAARDFTPSTRIAATSFWGVFIFLLESVLFILIGLAFPDVLERLGEEELGRVLLAAALVSLTVMAVRVAFTLGVGELETQWDRARGRPGGLTRRERAVVGWAGMRGAVSLAAALAVPLSLESGAAFPGRDVVLFLTFVVIGVTLVLQGLTLPLLIRRLGVEETESDGVSKALARFRTVEAALGRVSELGQDEERRVPQAAVERARELYATRAQQLAGTCRTGVPESSSADVAVWADLRLELIEVERAALLDLRAAGEVKVGVVREVERDLDLEQERLLRTGRPEPPPPGDDQGVPVEAAAV